MTALRGTFQLSTDSWAWSHSVQKQRVAHRCLLSSGCPKKEKKNYFSRLWSKSMLLNSPSASDEKQQSHGQAGDPSKDLRLPQPDLDLIKQVLWVGEALVLSNGWEVKDMCLYRKKRRCCYLHKDVKFPQPLGWLFWVNASLQLCVQVYLWCTVIMGPKAGENSHAACSFLFSILLWLLREFVPRRCMHFQAASFCEA